ncbi:MAG TPA: hypothetical protein PL155_04475 [Candidatus Omnitrophota bacterium]|nr:hypothetical protein [Candidatus Omnitrophota bacterium]HPD84268.1 hypothetical protein [Candidatus Omnitrophota bacterium]HRZ03124.1 hypothetical protein [Candidatus Omnitrophota bacterium]
MTVLGIDDWGIWSAYLLCILGAIFSVVYGIINWNKGDEEVYPEDVRWVRDEKKAEEEV